MKLIIYYFKFLLFKKNSEKAYFWMRYSYIVKKSKSIDLISFIQRLIDPKYKITESSGIFGKMNSLQIQRITNQIKINGYYKFELTLDELTIDKITEFACKMNVRFPFVGEIKPENNQKTYRVNSSFSNRFDMNNIEEINNCQELLSLITDENLLHIANDYLKTKPKVDIITLWWNKSLPDGIALESKQILLNKSAQMFHHDMDRLKFLKFFIYLTDVNDDNGPHIYVKNTHKSSPKYIKSDGRYDDQLVYQYSQDNVVSITGRRGTIIAVDTRGLHKGKEVIQGERLLFQIEFANSLFGKPEFQSGYLNLKYQLKYKRSYQLFSSGNK